MVGVKPLWEKGTKPKLIDDKREVAAAEEEERKEYERLKQKFESA